jgi:hypothetical protein
VTSDAPETFRPVDEYGGGRRRVGRRMPRGLIALVGAWLGAVVFFGAAVAPSAFAALPTPADAGALVGQLLPILFIAGIVVGVVLVIAAARFTTARPLIRRALAIVGALMIVTCALAQLWVAPEIDRVRASVAALDSLAPDDPVRHEFGRLHALSVALLGVSWLAGAALLVIGSIAPARRT